MKPDELNYGVVAISPVWQATSGGYYAGQGGRYISTTILGGTIGLTLGAVETVIGYSLGYTLASFTKYFLVSLDIYQ